MQLADPALRYRLFLLLLALGILVRTILMLTYFPALLLHADSARYARIGGGVMYGDFWMPAGYPMFFVVAATGVHSALVHDLDPARFGIGHRNFFVFINAPSRCGSSNRVYPRCDPIAFRGSSLSRAHGHGRSLDDLSSRGWHLGCHLWVSSEFASPMARIRQYVAGNGGVDTQRGRRAAADPSFQHCVVGEGIIPYQVRGRGSRNEICSA
jgi:hypothetical protein